jgi:hypothetical protein
MSHRSEILDRKFSEAQKLHDLPPNVMMVVARHVQDTLALKTSDEMKPFAEQLSDLLNQAVVKAPREVLDAVQMGFGSNQAFHDAYILGQLSFARSLIASATAKRVSARFFEMLESAEYEKYIRALLSGPLTNAHLQEAVGEDEKIVRKKLIDLRGEGIAEMRRQGSDVVNFLTHTAETMASCIYVDVEMK